MIGCVFFNFDPVVLHPASSVHLFSQDMVLAKYFEDLCVGCQASALLVGSQLSLLLHRCAFGVVVVHGLQDAFVSQSEALCNFSLDRAFILDSRWEIRFVVRHHETPRPR